MFTLRFSLHANAEFWAPTRPVNRMLVEADLDARNLPPIPVTTCDMPVRLALDPDRIGRERLWPGD